MYFSFDFFKKAMRIIIYSNSQHLYFSSQKDKKKKKKQNRNVQLFQSDCLNGLIEVLCI